LDIYDPKERVLHITVIYAIKWS